MTLLLAEGNGDRSVKIGKSRRIPTVAVYEYIDGLSA